MATKKKTRGLVEAATDAAVEVGRAAESLQRSWRHIKAAQNKARPATTAAARAGKRAISATKNTVRRATKAAKKTLSRRK